MEQIAGHEFVGGRCSCGRLWVDIRNTQEDEVDQLGIAHSGKLSLFEYRQILGRRQREDAALSGAMEPLSGRVERAATMDATDFEFGCFCFDPNDMVEF